MENTTQDRNVLAIEWHVPDNWYGKNYRYVLSKSETEEFKNAKEAKAYRTTLVKLINHRHSLKLTIKRATFGKLSTYSTYRYCSAGPSYACQNIPITVLELEAWKHTYESSEEYRQKKVKAKYRKENKMRRDAEKKARKERMKLNKAA